MENKKKLINEEYENQDKSEDGLGELACKPLSENGKKALKIYILKRMKEINLKKKTNES